MPLDDFAHNGEPRTRAPTVLLAPVQPPEDTKDGLVMLRSDANAIVPDVEYRLLRSPLARRFTADLDPFLSLVIVLDGIDNQVVENFTHMHAIGLHTGQPNRDAHVDLALMQPCGEQFDSLLDDPVDIDLFQSQFGTTEVRVVQERFEERLHALC